MTSHVDMTTQRVEMTWWKIIDYDDKKFGIRIDTYSNYSFLTIAAVRIRMQQKADSKRCVNTIVLEQNDRLIDSLIDLRNLRKWKLEASKIEWLISMSIRKIEYISVLSREFRNS